MLILIAPKFHPRHSEPRVAYTDSATIPVCRYYYIIFADIIAVTATLAATIHYICSRSLLLLAATLPPLIIFTAIVCNRRGAVHYIIAVARCITATANAAARAAVAYHHCSRYRVHYHCCRCRKYNRRYRHRRYYSNTIVTDVIANAIAAVISTAIAATVAVKF